MYLRDRLAVFKRASTRFLEVRPFQLAAALSYYTLLSLAPLVLVTISVTSLVSGKEVIGARLVAEVEKLAGPAGAKVVGDVILHASAKTSGLLLLVGMVTVLIGATSVFVQLEDALNQVWRIPARRKGDGLWAFVRGRVLSLAMVLGIGFLLLVSLLASAMLTATRTWALQTTGVPWILDFIDLAASLIVVTVLFALILKVLPAARVPWRHVWFGAAVTSLLFTAGKRLIALYLGRAGVGSAYGAAGSIVVLMVWVYYASVILLFGAQITQACTAPVDSEGSAAGP